MALSTVAVSDKRAEYQRANEKQDIPLVRELNALGWAPKEVPEPVGPSIVSSFMDIATKCDTIFAYLRGLRQEGRFFTKSEFEALPEGNWKEKDQLGRMLGCGYLARKIAELGLKHIKVPVKVAVMDKEGDVLNIDGYERENAGFYEIHSDQIKVFATRIKPVERKVSLDEMDEFIQLIAAAHFTDLNVANVIVAEDGLYIIDTEFKSFANPISWPKVGRFVHLLAESDQKEFVSKIEEGQKSFKENQDLLGYQFQLFVLRALASQLETEENRLLKENAERRVAALEYVGLKVAGRDFLKPNRFSYPLKTILS